MKEPCGICDVAHSLFRERSFRARTHYTPADLLLAIGPKAANMKFR